MSWRKKSDCIFLAMFENWKIVFLVTIPSKKHQTCFLPYLKHHVKNASKNMNHPSLRERWGVGGNIMHSLNIVSGGLLNVPLWHFEEWGEIPPGAPKNCYGDQTIAFITELVAGYLLVLFVCELLVWGRGDLAEDEHKLHNWQRHRRKTVFSLSQTDNHMFTHSNSMVITQIFSSIPSSEFIFLCKVRDGLRYQIGWIFGKFPNGL